MPVSNDPLDTTDSVVSESTDRPNSLVIKRAAVTYGRSRHISTENDTGPASYLLERDKVYSSTRPSVAEKLRPGSESSAELEHHEVAEADETCDESTQYTFPWKKKLEEWDNKGGVDSPPLSNSDENDALLPGQPGQERSRAHEACHASLGHSSEPPMQLTNDVLIESSVNEMMTSPSTPGMGPNRRRPCHRTVVHDSDSESEPPYTKPGSSANKSSSFILQTPNSRSSPTPPTSADEMPSLPTSKGKGKANVAIRRSNVSPLRFSEEPLSGAESGSFKSSTRDKRKKASRIKPPTKKERLETAKDASRLATDQIVSIPKTENNGKFSLQEFFVHITEDQSNVVKQASDPILPFSSSPSHAGLKTIETPTLVPRHEGGLLQTLKSSDNGAHPNTKCAPNVEPLSVEKNNKMKALETTKQRALALQFTKTNADGDEDDLEIIADDEMLPCASKLSWTRKQVSSKVVTLTKPGPEAKNKRPGINRKTPLNQAELSRMMAERVTEQNKRLVAQKNEEWVMRGGRPKVFPVGGGQDTLSTYVRKGLENMVMSSKARLMDEYEEGSQDRSFEEDNNGSETTDSDDQETIVHQIIEGDPQSDKETDDGAEEEAPRIKKRIRQNVAILDSDPESEKRTMTQPKDVVFKLGYGSLGSLTETDESDENTMPPPTLSFPSVHRGSVSSVDDQAEDRSDKENNCKLMFDRSEDKENKEVVKYDSHIRFTNARVNVCSSPKDEDVLKDDERSPLTILSEDKSSILQPDLLCTDTLSFRDHRSASPVVRKACLSELTSPIGERQSASGIAKFGAPRLLQDDFAELFESGTEDPKKEQDAMNKLPGRPIDSLELTQDVGLQPAFNVSDQLLLRRADIIFEKEQAYLFEAGNKKSEKKQLYVNDFGFLTQTRPHDEDVELYRSSYFTQRKGIYDGSSTKELERYPLSTLSLSMPVGEPIGAPRRRLVKRRTPSPNRSLTMRDSNSPTPGPSRIKNAFNKLAQGSKYLALRERQKLEKSEFFESEAEESEDDDVFGFLPNKNGDDEEEDGDDLDQTLEALVDDREMDVKTLNAPLVIEKFKEDMERDDQEAEKLHQAAIRGELRRKRRNRGFGLDDSDEEDDDEDERARKIRRKMNKSQRIDRGDIKALAKNEETLPFYKTYEHGILDEDDFKFQQPDVIMEGVINDDEQDGQSHVTREEIQHHAQELAKRKEIEPTLDPHDVSWIDADVSDEDIGTHVRIASVAWKKNNSIRRGGLDKDFDDIAETGKLSGSIVDEREMSRMQSWAKMECRSRHTTMRSGGGVAVTGHSKSKPKMNGGSVSTESTLQRNSQRRPLKATSSILADVSDRRSRFG